MIGPGAMAKEHRKIRAIPFPAFIEAEDPSDALRGTWSAVIEACQKVEKLVASTSAADRDAIRAIAKGLAALGAVIGRGDADALGEFANWSDRWAFAAVERDAQRLPRSLDRVNVAHLSDASRRPVAPDARDVARDIRETWARRTREAERLGHLLDGGIPPALLKFREENPNAILAILAVPSGHVIKVGGAKPGGIPSTIAGRAELGPGETSVCLIPMCMTRAAVAWDLAGMLQHLAEPWFTPGDQAGLASRIYKRMPLYNPDQPTGRRTDRAGNRRRELFVERHDRTIVAAFKVAGCPRDTAESLFKNGAE